MKPLPPFPKTPPDQALATRLMRNSLRRCCALGQNVGVVGGPLLGKSTLLKTLAAAEDTLVWVTIDVAPWAPLHEGLVAQKLWATITAAITQAENHRRPLPSTVQWPAKLPRLPGKQPLAALIAALTAFFTSLQHHRSQMPYILVLDNFSLFWHHKLSWRPELRQWLHHQQQVWQPQAVIISGEPQIKDGKLTMAGSDILNQQPLRTLKLLPAAAAQLLLTSQQVPERLQKHYLQQSGCHPYLLHNLAANNQAAIEQWCSAVQSSLTQQLSYCPTLSLVLALLMKQKGKFVMETQLCQQLSVASLHAETSFLTALGVVSRRLRHLQPEICAPVHLFNTYYSGNN